MAIQQRSYTPSQEASAAMHLDRAAEWVTFRVNGERYIALPSGNSGRTYWVRATADGCSCLYYERTGRQCSHMLAVERNAMLEELAEPAPVTMHDLRILLPGCAGGCGAITEGNLYCDECSAQRERAQRMAAARAKVLESWTT